MGGSALVSSKVFHLDAKSLEVQLVDTEGFSSLDFIFLVYWFLAHQGRSYWQAFFVTECLVCTSKH